MPVYELVVPIRAHGIAFIVADSKETAVERFHNDRDVRLQVYDIMDKDAPVIIESGEVLEQNARAHEVDTELVKAQTYPEQRVIDCKRAVCVFPNECDC